MHTNNGPSCGNLSCRVCRTAAEEKALQTIAEFDHPFQVTQDGKVQHARDFHAPEVTHVEGGQSPNDIEIGSDQWEALTGFTGQHGYNGAVMHSSEYLGGGLAAEILGTPGTYVVVAVEVLRSDACTCGAYPEQSTCSHCGGNTEKGEPAPIQGIWYTCVECHRLTLVIDGCECDDPEPAGWAILRKKVTWVGDEPQPDGTVGGDGADASVSIRYHSPEVPGALITSHWYTVDLRERGQADEEDTHVWDVENQVEFMRCTDVDDPGSTEVECDYEYNTPLGVAFDSEDTATRVRDGMVATERAEHFTWDGTSLS